MPLSRLFPFAVVWLCLSLASLTAAERPRLAVLTDIGGDPDDQQSMIRLMVYANEFFAIAEPAKERIHANW